MADSDPDRPPVKALLAQLAEDTTHFARAEFDWLRAEAGERWSYALPAFAMLGVGVALLFAIAIALPLGLMMALEPLVGAFWAVVIVMAGGGLIGAVLLRLGARRLKAAFKKPEDRP